MKFIERREELRSIYREPGGAAARKELTFLDPHCRRFISLSPFVLIGSSDGDGHADVTPKGDRPGFVAILDDRTLAIPDRPGNNRLDTLENVIVNPAVGLLFMIPGMEETLRVNGQARLTADEELRTRLSAEGKLPPTVMVVAVEGAYLHCAKAFMRSRLWQPESWPDRSEMPTLGKMLKDQLALAESADALDRSLDKAYAESMW